MQTYIHAFTHMHRHIHIHITHTCIHTCLGIHMCTRAYDDAHVHSIVNMLHVIQIFRACMQKHKRTTACTQTRIPTYTHICTHAYACSPCLSHMHALSCHVTLKDLSSSYNQPFPTWVLVHTETRQIMCLIKMHQKPLQKTHMHAQLSWRSTVCKFNKNFTPPQVLPHAPPLTQPPYNQPSDRKGLTQSKLTWKH